MASQTGAMTTTTSSISTPYPSLSSLISPTESSSTSSPTFLSATALLTPPKTTTKPIKLRAACNHCFSAKVRCDGIKEGCRRCSEKRLSCIYSESRVGKVVGKRRKRPLADPTTNINSQPWIINGTAGTVQSIASPANSNSRPQSSKEDCPVPNWTSFLVGSDQGLTNCNEATESLNAIDMANNRSFSAASDLSFFNNNGLPTPGLSPPQFARYLSPAQFEIRPSSRGMTDTSKLFPPSQVAAAPAPFIRNVCQSPVPPDDQETVCIKLLAHLKRHAGDVMQPRESQLVLLKKTNAAVRRILHSKTIRSAYTCHLLLSSILNQLVDLCELLCQQPASKASRPTTSTVDSQFLQDQVHFETFPGFFAGAGMPLTPPLDYKVVMAQVKDVMSFASTMGDMLKRKPLGGFQSLGRHETFHAELEQRLERAAGMVQLCHGSDWRTSNHV
ncbi:hypothetical protein LTS07_004903 [Exophiala sideris]|uniref:Zn(2)-C6 fungal-type domain-containing protein n=1 Tax=Exophiala sideris TaxID=1016849 RepID=A0ABR0JBV4_9EURO|nr:hypothetical protein LTS07_004903 [Exophiala sideris]KAK5038889.1 hypothetical protein LTR13_003920 [Exophiala sideris]KAK5060773.1 hypothetical protein LTR69_005372 [Exophiala sideris]KAK5183685.1 hypothetical protein LTR44_003967 [Eurotiomycetes sp. CCFEE 6388]